MINKLPTEKMSKTRLITQVAILAAISSIIMFLEFPLPFMPPFLKLDFSDIPALIAGLAFSPIAGVFVALVKNLIHLPLTQTGGVGELANFLICCLFILPPTIMYRAYRNTKSTVIGLLLGVVLMSVGAGILNYFVLLPLYAKFMPIDKIISMCATVNSLITNKITLIIYGITPFNIIKGVIISTLSYFLFRKLVPVLFKVR